MRFFLTPDRGLGEATGTTPIEALRAGGDAACALMTRKVRQFGVQVAR